MAKRWRSSPRITSWRWPSDAGRFTPMIPGLLRTSARPDLLLGILPPGFGQAAWLLPAVLLLAAGAAGLLAARLHRRRTAQLTARIGELEQNARSAAVE